MASTINLGLVEVTVPYNKKWAPFTMTIPGPDRNPATPNGKKYIIYVYFRAQNRYYLSTWSPGKGQQAFSGKRARSRDGSSSPRDSQSALACWLIRLMI